jgi:hypothetical protein
VRGGASRLLSHFLDEYWGVSSVVSFSANDYFGGEMYESIGFKLDKELAPDYTTLWGNRRHHKSFTKIANLIKLANKGLFTFYPNKSEVENLQLNNIRRAWDSGKKRWIYTMQ